MPLSKRQPPKYRKIQLQMLLKNNMTIYSNTDEYLERQKGAEVVCKIISILKRWLALN